MKSINCEHCGALINVGNDSVCPNCKAPYDNNKQYKEYTEDLKRQDDIELETKKLTNDNIKTEKKVQKIVLPIFLVIVIIGMVFVIIQMVNMGRKTNDNLNDYNNTKEEFEKLMNDFEENMTNSQSN